MLTNGFRSAVLLIIVAAMLATAGCTGSKTSGVSAGLTALSPEALAAWDIPNRLQVTGEGNFHRAAAGSGLGADSCLELAAGADGKLLYMVDMPAGPAVEASWRLEFLSTQGVGRLAIAGISEDGTIAASQGWVYTGEVPGGSQSSTWMDARYTANYTGDWIVGHVYPGRLSGIKAAGGKIVRYRLMVEVGQGQHAILTQMSLQEHPDAMAISLSPAAGTLQAEKGQTLEIAATVANNGSLPLRDIKVAAIEPFGFGLVCLDGRERSISELAVGEVRTLTWKVRAGRADAVNLGQPWQLGFDVNGVLSERAALVSVKDPNPGKVFYVMTEDLEPIDSAGYPAAWGNADGWLNPEEYQIQMIKKPEALNRIAERSGAKWTHYIAWPAVLAAEWADSQSTTGAWKAAVAGIRDSVRREAAVGHEYAIHLHMDYDPALPGNVLSYNAALDGLWANHLRHGWAHSLDSEGPPGNLASRMGSLYKYKSILDELNRFSGQGQLITARAGSFDFGVSGPEQEKSFHAFRAAGLYGTSDADGNLGGVTAGGYGKEIYLAGVGDINHPAKTLVDAALVEFRPTPQRFINYDHDSATQMNLMADAGMAYFAPQGRVIPGVHAIVGFTHAMFMMGVPDWTSVDGGQFTALDEHLSYLKERYAASGQLVFGTAGELVREYLDYYTPKPVALYGAPTSESYWCTDYPIRILGRDIPIDSEHPAQMRVKYPLYDRQSAFFIQVCKNGTVLSSTWGLPTPENDIEFFADDAAASYSIRVWHNQIALRALHLVQAVKSKIPWFGK